MLIGHVMLLHNIWVGGRKSAKPTRNIFGRPHFRWDSVATTERDLDMYSELKIQQANKFKR